MFGKGRGALMWMMSENLDYWFTHRNWYWCSHDLACVMDLSSCGKLKRRCWQEVSLLYVICLVLLHLHQPWALISFESLLLVYQGACFPFPWVLQNSYQRTQLCHSRMGVRRGIQLQALILLFVCRGEIWQTHCPQPKRAAAVRLTFMTEYHVADPLGMVQCWRNKWYCQASLSPIQVLLIWQASPISTISPLTSEKAEHWKLLNPICSSVIISCFLLNHGMIQISVLWRYDGCSQGKWYWGIVHWF